MKNMFKLGLVVALVSGSTMALATTPGTYVGAGLGYSQYQLNGFNKDPFAGTVMAGQIKVGQQNGAAAGRLFAGYNFNQNFGVEGGYNYFGASKVTYKYAPSSNVQNGSFTNQAQAADLVGKAYLPLSNSGFDLYALGGAAYVKNNISANGSVTVPKSTASSSKVDPKFGVGLGYAIPNTALTTSLELSRIQGSDSKFSSNPSLNNAMLTVSYTFN